MPAAADADLVVAYHSACSMQHGQRITAAPKQLLAQAGFTVKDVPEGHLCCGSAGTYNILQPEIASRLRDRKVANIQRVAPDLIATGNIGCITQIAAAHRRSRSSTPSSSSTGPPADRGRRRCGQPRHVCDRDHEPARWKPCSNGRTVCLNPYRLGSNCGRIAAAAAGRTSEGSGWWFVGWRRQRRGSASSARWPRRSRPATRRATARPGARAAQGRPR